MNLCRLTCFVLACLALGLNAGAWAQANPQAAQQEFDSGVAALRQGAYSAGVDILLQKYHQSRAHLQTVTQADALLDRFALELGDHHSAVIDPARQHALNQKLSSGLITVRGYVVAVLPGADPVLQRVRLGDQLVSVDGIPLSDRAGMQRLKASDKTTLRMVFARNQQPYTLNITRTTHSPDAAAVVRPLSAHSLYFLMPSNTPRSMSDRSAPDGGPYVTENAALLAKYASPATCGVIVDLRLNPGGLMGGQLALASTLFDLGHNFLTETGTHNDLTITDSPGPGQVVSTSTAHGTVVNVHFMPAHGRNLVSQHPWVALLTSPNTASSGELVALASKSDPHTRIFGETTAGDMTHLVEYALPSGTLLVLSYSFFNDVHGKIYPHGVVPDVMVKTDPAHFGQASDPVIQAAQAWLKGKGCQ